MRQTRTIELGTGLFVLLGFAALFYLVLQITNRDISLGSGSYRLSARFTNVGSLKVGAPVSMGGVTIGRVESIDFDQNDFKAVVQLRLNPKYDKIPDDSDAAIYTAGLLGGHYVGITPGGADTYFKDKDQIQMTQSAIVLENLISKFLFSKAGDDGAKTPSGKAVTP
jgi:phospholipid/cholesterol/gamma-HCH transport system substrate-binding protein